MKITMLNKIKTGLLLAAIAFLGLFSLVPKMTLAVDTQSAIQCGINSAASGSCNQAPPSSLDSTIKNIVNILSAAVGVVAVIMIMIGGFRYVTSSGNPEAAKGARNTIVYAVIGLVVVAVAQVIVHFVLGKVS